MLCYLYLSPERLAQQGIFSTQEVYDELLNLADEGKLLKAVNQRSSGSDLDKQKLAEKVRSAIGRLRRLGMIHTQIIKSFLCKWCECIEVLAIKIFSKDNVVHPYAVIVVLTHTIMRTES